MNTTDKPKFQEFDLEGVKHMSPLDAYDLLVKNEAVLIDVRSEQEIASQIVPLDNVLYHPMEKIADRLKYISQDQNILLICLVGIKSSKVANLLNMQGYPHIANVDGGMEKWIEMNLPVGAGIQLSTFDCGCGGTS